MESAPLSNSQLEINTDNIIIPDSVFRKANEEQLTILKSKDKFKEFTDDYVEKILFLYDSYYATINNNYYYYLDTKTRKLIDLGILKYEQKLYSPNYIFDFYFLKYDQKLLKSEPFRPTDDEKKLIPKKILFNFKTETVDNLNKKIEDLIKEIIKGNDSNIDENNIDFKIYTNPLLHSVYNESNSPDSAHGSPYKKVKTIQEIIDSYLSSNAQTTIPITTEQPNIDSQNTTVNANKDTLESSGGRRKSRRRQNNKKNKKRKVRKTNKKYKHKR